MTQAEATMLFLAKALLETVQECPDGAPSGPMYMAVNAKGVSLDQYQAIMNALVKAGRIRYSNHCYYPI